MPYCRPQAMGFNLGATVIASGGVRQYCKSDTMAQMDSIQRCTGIQYPAHHASSIRIRPIQRILFLCMECRLLRHVFSNTAKRFSRNEELKGLNLRARLIAEHFLATRRFGELLALLPGNANRRGECSYCAVFQHCINVYRFAHC